MAEPVEWTTVPMPDWPETKQTAKIGNMLLIMWSADIHSWSVRRDGFGDSFANGWSYEVAKAKQAAEAVARIELTDD